MSKSRRILVVLFVSLVTLALPAALLGAVGEVETAREMLALSIIPQSAEPVSAGEPAVFKILVTNSNGQNQTDLALTIAWDKEQVERAKLELVMEETRGVLTQAVRREAGTAVWRGGIQAGGQLTMRLTLLPVVCNDETIQIGVGAALGQASGGDKITAKQSLAVNCPKNGLGTGDLLIASAIDTLSPYEIFGTAADILTGMDGHLKIELTNKSSQAMNALVTDFLAPQNGQEGQCTFLPSQVRFETQGAPTLSFDRGYLPPVAVDQAAADSQPFIGFMVLELPPGETWTADLLVPLRARTLGCEFSGMATVYPAPANPIPGSCDGGSPDCRYRGWTLQARDLRNLLNRLPSFDSNSIRARLVAPDLGDAPASENNFDEIMQAYSGIKADFPTVYNLKIGIPPAAVNSAEADHREAPLHLYARPLRLGQLVSIEREADVNPNRNINPQTGISNLDFRDDGWPAGELPGSCTPFAQKVRITVEDWAVNYFRDKGSTAYLNVFVDANGDGDWEDVGSCAGRPAPEHVIINLPIDISALGAGQHEIELPANRGVEWQTDQTWLRLTLGDEKAPLRLKDGNIAHGDGGGPENGYYLGETEDYRFRVGDTRDSTAVFGADLALSLETNYQFMGNHSPAQLAQTFGIRATECLTCIEDCYGGGSIITLGNLGDLFAPNSKLVVLPDPALRSNDVQISVKGDLSWTDTIATDIACSPTDPNCRVEVDLGDVPPQAFGSLFVYASASCRPNSQACKKTEYKVRATVASAGDANTGNNQAEEKINLPLAPEWLEPPSITYPIPGTMAGGDLRVTGGGKPGRTVEIYLNGAKVATGDVNNDGLFDIVIPSLVAEGEINTYQLAAGYEIPGGKRNPTRGISVVLDNETGLFIDPISLTFHYDNDGTKYAFHPWDESGRVDPNGWRVPLIEGSSYDVSVRVSEWYCITCTLGINANGLSLAIGDSQTIATLTDIDGDGTFSGSFTANQGLLNKPLTLNVSSEGVEQGFSGESFAAGKLPRLIDGQTGQIVDGADFILWQSLKVAGDQIIMVRPQAVNGQPNPRTSGKDGEFFFNVTPGYYQLQISSPGGQLNSFTELQRTFGMLPTEDIILNTNANQTNEPQVDLVKETVVSISADGFSPSVIEAGLNEQIVWQNIDLQNRGVRSLPEGIDSGYLPAGGTFTMSFDKVGSFVVEDPFDPGNMAVVILKPAFGGYDLFLPALLKK